MNKILIVLLVFGLGLNTVNAQKDLNDFKYIIVPNKYDFLNQDDKFQLNSLTKFLFNKYGFKAYLASDTYPNDLQDNNCLALRANVMKRRGLLTTKLQVELKDCSNTVVYETQVGESRKKEFKVAYNLALRDAFESFESIDHSYNGNAAMSEEVEPVSRPMSSSMTEKIDDVKETKTVMNSIEPVKVKEELKVIEKKAQEKTLKKLEIDSEILYAQSIEGGFQIVDNTPKVIYKIAYSGVMDVFIVLGKDAILHKVKDAWTLSEVKNGDIQAKVLNIKF